MCLLHVDVYVSMLLKMIIVIVTTKVTFSMRLLICSAHVVVEEYHLNIAPRFFSGS